MRFCSRPQCIADSSFRAPNKCTRYHRANDTCYRCKSIGKHLYITYSDMDYEANRKHADEKIVPYFEDRMRELDDQLPDGVHIVFNKDSYYMVHHGSSQRYCVFWLDEMECSLRPVKSKEDVPRLPEISE